MISLPGASAADAMSVSLLLAGTQANATLQERTAAHDTPNASADKAAPRQRFYEGVSTVALNSIDLYGLDLPILHACYRSMLHACCRNILDECCMGILHETLIAIVHLCCTIMLDGC
jgi:hypothetical protein